MKFYYLVRIVTWDGDEYEACCKDMSAVYALNWQMSEEHSIIGFTRGLVAR